MSSKARLTNAIRLDILKRVASEVPSPKLLGLEKLFQEIVDKDVALHGNPHLAAMWADQKLRDYLNIQYPRILSFSFRKGDMIAHHTDLYMLHELIFSWHTPGGAMPGPAFQLSKEAVAEIIAARGAAVAELEAIQNALKNLMASLQGCATFASLIEKHPELEGHLPRESRAYPLAIVGATDALKALGWPKGSKGA